MMVMRRRLRREIPVTLPESAMPGGASPPQVEAWAGLGLLVGEGSTNRSMAPPLSRVNTGRASCASPRHGPGNRAHRGAHRRCLLVPRSTPFDFRPTVRHGATALYDLVGVTAGAQPGMLRSRSLAAGGLRMPGRVVKCPSATRPSRVTMAIGTVATRPVVRASVPSPPGPARGFGSPQSP